MKLRIVCQDALDCLAEAGVEQAFVVISDQKFEVMRFLSNGEEYGVRLAYLHQRDINGLPYAVDCANQWVQDRNCVLLLPDTLLEPRDAVRQALDFLDEHEADVVLGIFPTERPADLCPVEFDSQGRVSGLYDKDASHGIMNTWGFVVWGPNYTAHLHQFLLATPRPEGRELTFAEVILSALHNGLHVRALSIKGGKFVDIGKNSSLVEARLTLERRAAREE